MTVSVDRSLVVHDMFTNRQCALMALPEALTCCASNPTFDFAYAGSSSGRIYIVTLSPFGTALAAAHAKRLHNQSEERRLGADVSQQAFSASFGRGRLYDADILLGHGKPVVGMAHSADNVTLVSVSADGDMRLWNTVTRQCTKIISPFSKNPISNVMVSVE
jgi:WD40 repeat protein